MKAERMHLVNDLVLDCLCETHTHAHTHTHTYTHTTAESRQFLDDLVRTRWQLAGNASSSRTVLEVNTYRLYTYIV
jgi:hypothetical protein